MRTIIGPSPCLLSLVVVLLAAAGVKVHGFSTNGQIVNPTIRKTTANTISGHQQLGVTTESSSSSTTTSFSRTTSSLSMVAPGTTSIVPKLAIKGIAVVASALLASTGIVKLVLDKPSRTYGDGSVAQEYDDWAEEGILEYYWGEHIHLGYYGKDVKYKYKPLQDAQYAFIDEMMKFGGIDPSVDGKAKVLDVGCGFGGTSRYLARALGPESSVTAITLSPKQVQRAQELAIEQNTPNANFQVEDALAMSFPDNTFDIVWACESGEHMPDKKKYIDQMMRVLKPGGKFVMATWCQRDDRVVPFDKRDLRDLQYLYEEWYVFWVTQWRWDRFSTCCKVLLEIQKNIFFLFALFAIRAGRRYFPLIRFSLSILRFLLVSCTIFIRNK
jgi:ubiquinone/menaquinone biosynthesis C-methylase UbiE